MANNKQEPFIISSIENGIQKVIFNRPSKKNAITKQVKIFIDYLSCNYYVLTHDINYDLCYFV